MHLNLGLARYGDKNEDLSLLFPELVEWLERFVSEALNGYKNPSGGEGLGEFWAGATMFKHRGFHEEREVRIVAVPGSEELQAQMIADDPSVKLRSLKAIDRSPQGVSKRHISLFQGLNITHLVKRVIVGPSRDQQKNALKARDLMGAAIPVLESETPFIGDK